MDNCRDKCIHRGKVNGCSQETYCSQCFRGSSWKKDYYDEGTEKPEGNQCDGCARGLRVINGLHVDDGSRPIMRCCSHLYA